MKTLKQAVNVTLRILPIVEGSPKTRGFIEIRRKARHHQFEGYADGKRRVITVVYNRLGGKYSASKLRFNDQAIRITQKVV